MKKLFSGIGIMIILVVSLLAGMSFPVDGQNEKTALDMNLLYGNFNGTVKAGQDNIIYFEVRNSGTTALTHITFSSLVPDNWKVTFSPDSIESLSPGGYMTIEANVRPAAGSGERNNNITFIAESAETRQILSVYTQLESTSGYWMWVGLSLAVACIAGFIWVYFRLNRAKT